MFMSSDSKFPWVAWHWSGPVLTSKTFPTWREASDYADRMARRQA